MSRKRNSANRQTSGANRQSRGAPIQSTIRIRTGRSQPKNPNKNSNLRKTTEHVHDILLE
jgi:hypothetical protein